MMMNSLGLGYCYLIKILKLRKEKYLEYDKLLNFYDKLPCELITKNNRKLKILLINHMNVRIFLIEGRLVGI